MTDELRESHLQMSEAELRALPVTVDIVTAGRALGLGRSKSYELAQKEQFPVEVLRLGVQYRVRKTALIAYLTGEAAEHEAQKAS